MSEDTTIAERLHRLFVFLSTAGMSLWIGPHRQRNDRTKEEK